MVMKVRYKNCICPRVHRRVNTMAFNWQNAYQPLTFPPLCMFRQSLTQKSRARQFQKVTTPFSWNKLYGRFAENQMLDLYFTVSRYIRSHAESFYKADGYKAIDNKSHENELQPFIFAVIFKKIPIQKLDKHIFIRQLPTQQGDYIGQYERLFRSSQVSRRIFFFEYGHKFGSRTSISVNPGIVWEHSRLVMERWMSILMAFTHDRNQLRHQMEREDKHVVHFQTLQNIGYPLGMKNGLTIRDRRNCYGRGGTNFRSKAINGATTLAIHGRRVATIIALCR